MQHALSAQHIYLSSPRWDCLLHSDGHDHALYLTVMYVRVSSLAHVLCGKLVAHSDWFEAVDSATHMHVSMFFVAASVN